MKFDDLDKKMRVYETINDQYVLPGVYAIARIDGRCFTRLTKEVHQFEAPFDIRFRDMMVQTVKHLMTCGFKILYGYTQSDEISLLLDPRERIFEGKERKLNSILASEAAAQFSVLLGDVASFDCRISQFPKENLVADYFRWRNEDASRNALNGYCYWMLRDEGLNATQATKQLSGVSVAQKNELLFQKGINFNSVPAWQKRGIGLYWESYEKQAINPKTGQKVMAQRKRLKIDYDLPMKDAYSDFINKLIHNAVQST